MKCRLPYIQAEAEIYQSNYGFTEMSGLDVYKDTKLRSKVIFKLDLLYSLDTILTASNIEEYRSIIYGLISGGYTDIKQISMILESLYLDDNLFRTYISEYFYFGNMEKCGEKPFVVLIRDIHQRIDTAKKYLIKSLKENGSKCIAESHCFLYFAVNDSDAVVRIPTGYHEEVISCGKVWNGTFSKYGPAVSGNMDL